METFATLGEMLLKRYVTDYIGQMQQLSAPVHSRLKENTRFTPSGEGAFFAVRIDGNEAGGGWRGKDDNRLPSAGNERRLKLRSLNLLNCWNALRASITTAELETVNATV